MKQATTSPTRDRKIGYQSQHWQWKLNCQNRPHVLLSLSLSTRWPTSRPYPTIEPRGTKSRE